MPEQPETARSEQRSDGFLLLDLVRGACRALETNRDTVNALNVFPVPDGDTGTNMLLTMRSVRDELEQRVEANAGATSAFMARSALLAARGNSGLILAQFFKGLAESLTGKETVDGQGLARGLRIATDTAYRAVPQPREGTMLTVFRECADASEAAANESLSLDHVMRVAAEQAMDTVSRTPQMLDVLRDAGVVDSGGFGFAIMLHSGVEVLSGLEPGTQPIDPPGIIGLESGQVAATGVNAEFLAGIEGEAWGYCTVFAVEGTGLDADAVRDEMSALGRSAVVAGSDTVLKIHVHAEDPGVPLSAGIRLGSLSNIEIHNMDEQTRQWTNERENETKTPDAPPVCYKTAIVAVALGKGFEELFENAGLGAVRLLAGGDTMNPSTAEILEAIEAAPSDCVIVLPNNKNIIGTALQAVELTEKHALVVETRSMQAGLAALLEFSPERQIDQNHSQMTEPLDVIRAGSVSRASRDALLDGVAVRRGQFMGVLDEKLVSACTTPLEVLQEMLEGQVDEESLLTIYTGADINDEASQAAEAALSDSHPGLEIEILRGGQPDYEFLLSIE